MKKRYDGYLVQTKDGVRIKEVQELTEEEAKIELAKAIDCIGKLEEFLSGANEVYREWINGEVE